MSATESSETGPEEYRCRSCGDVVDIVGLIEHDCDRVLSADELSSSERSTLLYVEAMIVDNGARLHEESMNHEDFQNLKVFKAAGLLETEMDGPEQIVRQFTDTAWNLAGECRRKRGRKNLRKVEI